MKNKILRTDRLLAALVALLALFAAPQAYAQFSLTTTNYTQNFNGLGTATTNVTDGNLNNITNTLNGWYFRETGSTTNTTITANNGSASAGDTYNYGATSGADRSLGGLAVNNTVPTWGFWFSNSLGATITNLQIAYTGETWRFSVTNRADTVAFAYSGSASNLGGTFTNFSGLDYTNTASSVITNGSTTGLPVQTTAISNNLSVSILAGGTFFIRWSDVNISGNDDGLSIDDFSLTAFIQAVIAALNWSGGSGNWDTGFGGAVTNGSALSFSGAGGIATNNLSSPLISSMTFSNGAGSYTVAGNAFTISNGIVNSSANAQTFSNAITLGAAQTFDAAAGAMTFAGDINNGGNVLTIGGASNTVISGIISGAAGLTKSGAGTVTLNGVNTFTGTITANGGVISSDNDSELGNSANDITFGGGTLQTTASIDMGSGRDLTGTGATFDIANGTTLTNGGTINLTTVTLANSGTFVMNGASKTISGLTFSVASTLTNTGAAAVLSGNVTANNTSGTVVMAGAYNLGTTNRTFTVSDGSAATDLQLTGAITNTNASGYIIKAGTGRMEITGVNTALVGGVQLGTAGSAAAGTLSINNKDALGLAQFRLNSGTFEASTALTGANAITNNLSIGGRAANAAIIGGANAIEFTGTVGWFGLASTASTLQVNNATTLSGVITNGNASGVTFEFGGTGTLTLSGASGNTFTNALTISNTGLTLVLGKNDALGTTAAGTTLQSGSTILFSGVDYTTAEALTIAGTGVGGNGALRGSGTSTFAGAVTATAATTIAAGSGADFTISGALNAGGSTVTAGGDGNVLLSGAVTNGNITKTGAGSLTISNASSSFGTLTTGTGTTALGANATATGLGGSGALNLAGGTFTLNNAIAQTFSGVISGGGAFVKTGAGTATLSGNSGSFTGATTVTNGTLVVNGNLSGSAVSVGHASLAEGSVLMGTGSVGATTINTNGVIAPGNSVGILSVSNTLTWNGGGSYLWEINGTNGPAGTTWDLITVDTTSAGDGLGTLNLPGSGQFTINGEAIDAFVFDGDQDYLGNFFLIAEAGTINGSLGNLAFIGSGLGLGTWSFATNATGLYLNYEAPAGVITFTPTGVVSQSESAVTPAGDYSTITGGFAVIIDGAGTLVMTNAANDYTGTTSVLGGTLRADVNAPNSAAGAFGNSITAVQVGDTSGSDSATLDIGVDGVTIGRAIEVVAGSSGTKTVGTSLSSGTATYSGAVVLGTTSQLTSGGTANAVFSGQISGTGGITKVGDGTVTLSGSGANSFGGAATVSAGTLLLNKTGVEAVTTSITVNGGTLMLGAANQIANTATVTLGGGSFDLGGNNEQITTLQLNNGTLSNGTLTAGTYNLAGGTVSGNLGTGTINASANAALNGTAAATTVNITGGTLTLGSASRLTGTSPAVNLSGGGALALGGNESIGTLRLTNGTVSGSGILSVATAINAENGTLSANIGGNAGLTKTTATTVTLSGANTFSGAVAVNGGTLILTNGAALSDTAAVTLGNISGVTLQIDSNETIGSLAGGGAAGGVLALGANSLSLSGAGDTTYSGNITGTGKLVQAGTGTLTLNRTANYTGTPTVRIESGAVRADNLGSSYGLTGDVVELAGSGAAFIVKGTANANFPLTLTALDIYQNGTLMLERGGGSASSSHTQNIPLNFRGGVLTLAYSNITGGTITYAGAANTLFANGGITGTNFTAAITAGITESGGSYSFTKAGANTLVLNGVNTYTGDTIVTGGELRIGATGALSDSSLVNVSGGALVSFLGSDTVKGLSGAGNVSVASATALTLSNTAIDTFSGAITNAGSLVKVGAGTQVLSGAANSYSGTTTVGGGTLQVSTLANSNSNSSIGSGSSVVLTNGGVLDYTGSTVSINRAFALSSGNGGIGVSNAATDLTLSGAITGTGNLVKSGAGTLTLTGANTYNGATTVSAGTLELARTGGTATLPSTTSISVAQNAVLLISQSDQVNNNAAITLSGGTITRGSGVNEVFGSLNLTTGSFLDFGTGAAGNLTFGTYTPSALLTVNNFLPGNTLTFASNLTSEQLSTNFTFDNGFTSNWNGSTFTITAIPEPSTYAAAIGLLVLMLWPSRKRIVRDAKKILGFTPPMRDRLARSRQ